MVVKNIEFKYLSTHKLGFHDVGAYLLELTIAFDLFSA